MSVLAGAPPASGPLSGAVAAKAGAVEDAQARDVRKLLAILMQLAVLVLVIHRFQIESEAFFNLAVFTAAGVGVHYFLPLQHRLPFFVFLSLGGIVLVLGLEQGAWLVGLGLAVLGIAHLPIGLRWRAGILILAGLALAAARVVFPRYGLGEVPWSAAVWPIFGSMFVFRLINYLYDCSHQAGPTRFSQVLAYFFMLPNVCFPLFPVVDFKKFCRNYYDADRYRIYQVGIEWIWRGLLQLIFYRLVYYHLVLDPVAVTNLAELVVHMLSTIALYVRISGYFHLVVGMLHLFGFNLPETNHRYFLASSFTDFWRRINIYWKDFMMKVFYYPAFFRLRRLGDTRALVLATLFTFLVTWFLHAVQWFWIRGGVLLELNDITFWSLFAVLMLVNALYENKYGRKRALSRQSRTLGQSVGLVFRTLGTFAIICTMWSFWSSESATDWGLMVSGALKLPPWSVAQFVGTVAALLIIVSAVIYAASRGGGTQSETLVPRYSPATILVSGIALCVLTTELITKQAPGGQVLASLRSTSLNRRDAEHFQRGYYENLVEVRKFNQELRRVYQREPDDFVRSLGRAGLSRPTGDELGFELAPLATGSFYGAMVQTNRWGMRYRDCTRARPPGSYRFAVVGPSIAMGSGVEEEDSFTVLLEERLNRERFDHSPAQYELLNFGIAAYTPLQQMYQIRRKVFSFEPNALLYIGHGNEAESAATHLVQMYSNDADLPDRYLQELVERTGLRRRSGPTETRRRMLPVKYELLEWIFRDIVSGCRERNVLPIYVYFEMATDRSQPWRMANRAPTIELARKAGFIVLDLTGVYEGYTEAELCIAESDGHPNALGQRLIADRLFDLLRERSDELALGLADAG